MFGSRSKDRYGALDNLEKWKNPNYGHSYARAKLRIARVRTTYEVEE